MCTPLRSKKRSWLVTYHAEATLRPKHGCTGGRSSGANRFPSPSGAFDASYHPQQPTSADTFGEFCRNCRFGVLKPETQPRKQVQPDALEKRMQRSIYRATWPNHCRKLGLWLCGGSKTRVSSKSPYELALSGQMQGLARRERFPHPPDQSSSWPELRLPAGAALQHLTVRGLRGCSLQLRY